MAGKEFPLAIVLRAVDKATADIRKVNKRISKIGESVTKVGKKLTTGLTLPIAAAGAASAKAFGEFQQGMSNVSTLIDTSKESLDEMGREVLAIGRRSPVAINDLTASLYDVRSAGVDAANQFTVLEQSARLGVAGLGTTAQSVDLVTSSINAFGLEGEEAEKVYDNVFKTVKFGKTNIAQLSQGFGAVAGTVAATGTKLDEYLASVSALTTTGLPAAQAHSQLRAVISGLTRETDKSRKVFRKLGAKDFKDLIAKSGGMVPALEKISGVLKGNEARILEVVGSTEALNAILGLTGKQNATFTETLREMREGANAVDEAFEKQNNTLQAQVVRTKNAMTSVAVSVGAILAPSLEKLAGVVQRVADWFGNLDEGTREWIVQVGLVVAAVGPALAIFGKLISAFAVLKTVIAAVGAAVKAVTLIMMANPIILIVTGIAVAALLIYKYWDPIKAFFLRLWERVREPFFRFLGWVKAAFLNFTPLGLIIKHWEPLKAFFSALWDGVVTVFEGAWEIIRDIVDGIAGVVDTITGAVSKVGDAVGSVGSAIGGFFGGDDEEDALPRGSLSDAFAGMGLDGIVQSSRQTNDARVKVEFENAPRGARVASDPSSTADVDLSVGYQMVIP